MAAWAGRWFGPLAIGPAGVACLALIPLWDQDRGADIDALNTVAAVVTAMFVLELAYSPRRRMWPWVVGLAAGVGATLLLKGPAGLPPVIGAMVGPSIALRDWRWAKRPAVWIGVAIGAAVFVGWIVSVKVAVRRAGIVVDTGGVREGLQRMVLHRGRDVLPAVVAPFVVLLYAVPASLAIPFAVRMASRDPADSDRRRRIVAVLATVAAGLLLFVVAGNGNPRYEYVMLPPLAVIVGAVAAGELSAGERRAIRAGLAGFVVLLVGLGLFVAVRTWTANDDRIGTAVAGTLAVAAAAAWLAGVRRTAIAGAVVVLLAVPMGDRKNVERQTRSARAAATQLRAIVGDGPVAVASMNRDMPELMYYADVQVKAYGERGLAKLAAEPGGRWAIVTQSGLFPEYKTLTAQVPGAFPRGLTRLALPATAREQVYVGWYDPPAGVSRVVTMPVVTEDDGDDG